MFVRFSRSPVESFGLLLGTIVTGLAPVAFAVEPKPEREPVSTPAELAAASEGNGRFAVDLYRRLAELNDSLRSLGMVQPFEDPAQNPNGAQFDNLSSTRRLEDSLFISAVVHKTFVDVSEIGTEAAAATAVTRSTASAPSEVKTRPFHPIFKADKPFIFLIRDLETAAVLFLGRYAGPKG